MADEKQKSELWLIRHGETEWSLSGAHTSFTDLPLTEHGREQAMRLQPILGKTSFGLVLTSPRTRARVTAQLAGLGVGAQVDGDLQEWNYGVYEGKSTPEIRKEHPGWNVWKDPITGGETLAQVALRAQCVIERCLAHGGRCALFAHAHIFRILAGVWCGALDVSPEALARSGAFGEHLGLSTASISVLGFERDTRVISRWNELPPACSAYTERSCGTSKSAQVQPSASSIPTFWGRKVTMCASASVRRRCCVFGATGRR